MRRPAPRGPSRRQVLRAVGVGLASIPLAACSSTGPAAPDASTGDAGPCGPAAAWATGGTAAMTARSCYPDPFATAVTACPLVVCATTAGPCTASAPVRQDVSEGYPGLPVRLALQLVDATTCSPVSGASVEIWHTQVAGVYSGVTPSPAFCSGGDADAPNHSYFRGVQTTDAAGRVDFDTCFPGWYPGRAIHIHLQVTVGGTSYVVSQLFFDQPLVESIFDGHVDYAPHGRPDTRNQDDGVLGGRVIDPYLLDTARMADGAMLASKVIALRGPAQANCA